MPGVLDRCDVDRITMLAGKAQEGLIEPDEKGEGRRILAGYTEKAWDLSWEDLLHVAFFFVGMAELSQPVPADAS